MPDHGCCLRRAQGPLKTPRGVWSTHLSHFYSDVTDVIGISNLNGSRRPARWLRVVTRRPHSSPPLQHAKPSRLALLPPQQTVPQFEQRDLTTTPPTTTMADEDEIAALVIDNGSGMCKGGYNPVQTRGETANDERKGGGCWPQVGPTALNQPRACGAATLGISGSLDTFWSPRWQPNSIYKVHTLQRT